MTFHHIGIAVDNIDSAKNSLTSIGFKPTTNKVIDEKQKATLQMFSDSSSVSIELVEGPVVKDFLIYGTFKIYHVCFEVDDILNAVDSARKAGYIQITGYASAPLFSSRMVVFMMNNDEFIIEFLQSEKKEKKCL